MTATDSARVDGRALSGIVPDRNWERALIGRWRNGAGTERLARDFAVPLPIVEALIKGQIRQREARPQDFDDVTARLTPSALACDDGPMMGGGDGQPKYACHGDHVAAVLAQGGYPAAVKGSAGTMVVWPDLAARRRAVGQ